ncbi:glycosyl transferase family 1 [Sediminicola sp. YIK13]|uniref:glycosyltransferase family 4 protein n=1 Tax=Sediminicola sp. YIK13 TaxID=1453352 RepID=UPI0007223945|nr:glycosyltransferase family 4 protein [Sediminicola sp. YIK13]ALM07203.1 glycosyl transferase family 1 [Sediminicola sp. YIK13]
MKKALIITYYWPPAGGPGVQRWLKFVKYLRDFEVEPVVYVPENPEYPIMDFTFENEIPEGIKIYKQKIFEPYQLASIFSKKKTKSISSGIIQTKDQSLLEKVLLWIRGNLFIPDARKFWIKPSVRYLQQVIEEQGIETIITTGPPHSVHLIGMKLKANNSIQWIADFRDPWTSIGYHKKLKLTKSSQKRHLQLESEVLNRADSIIVTSNTTKKEFSNITDQPITVITNGFDSRKFSSYKLDDAFTISHIGSLLSGRNPIVLWQALKELTEENADFRKNLVLELIGVVSKDVLESIQSHQLEPYVRMEGYVSHEKAIERQQRSQVLLLVEIDSEETKGIIPGKFFEYIAADRPILGVGPEGWEVAQMISETCTGSAFTYMEAQAIKTQLLEWFIAYQKKELYVKSQHIEQYSRRELTGKLAQLI